MLTTTIRDAALEGDDGNMVPELLPNEQHPGNTIPYVHDDDRTFDLEMNNLAREEPQGWSLSSSSSSEHNLPPVEPSLQPSLQAVDEEQAPQEHEARSIRVQLPDMEMDLEEDAANTLPTVRPPLTGIEACIDRIIRNPILVRDSSGRPDTFIYIGRLCLQNQALEDQMQDYFCSHPILVERSKLEALNSPYFNKCFDGMYQTRKWKSLSEKAALHVLPPGIKYIINMTPEIEGLEAVQSLQDLSCPFGVLHWMKSRARWSTRGALVGGLDENDDEVQPGDIAMEYSCIRHVKSIERFMTALQGIDPKFDSAPKIYTAVMVSKAWGIQGSHPLIDYTACWLFANYNFVEAFPETVLKMADVLKCAALCQDSFSVLVGEAALDSSITHPFNDGKTAYERVRGDIEEDWLSRIQHARNSFVDRVKDVFNSLAGERMEWVASLHTIRDMRLTIRRSGRSSEVDNFLHLLKRFIRGAIYKLLCDEYLWINQPHEENSTQGDDLYPHGIGGKVWSTLRAPERIFTARFWKVMAKCYLKADNSDYLTNQSVIRTYFLDRGLSSNCIEYERGSLMERITIKSLIEAVPAQNPNGNASTSVSNQSRGKNMSNAQKVERSLSSLKQIVSTSSNESPFQVQHSQGNVLPLRIPSFGESTAHDHSRPLLAACSSLGCMKIFTLPSLPSVCLGCQRDYCQGHVEQDQHGCHAPRTGWITQRQKRQPSPSFETEETDQDVKSNEITNDPTHSIPTRDRKSLSLIQEILHSAVQHIQMVARQMLSGAPGGNLGTLDNSSRIAYTLSCLTEDEIKFLPLWAEGLDDGTGGVFGEHVPSTNEEDLGYKSNGRHLVTRSEGSDYSFVSETVDSTVNTSTIAHDGHRDTLPRKQVIAVDEMDSSSSEGGWSYIQDSVDIKGKNRAAPCTQEGSEVASTLGALEDASVIDLGITSGTTSVDTSTIDQEDMEILSSIDDDTSSAGTIQEAEIQDDADFGDSEDFYDDDDDDDMGMVFDDDLTLSSQAPVLEAQIEAPSSKPFTTSLWDTSKSMAHVSYVYKDEPDHDFMTRP
ncbi:MAG: hypothetical protein GOMPHAMPRED_000435 [Gomphillus americanus]|uniref:Uncharacterized protein n=1 Tax=Gomphillus americanus TaxID=1940652 RepID=A0A8H3EGM4_9LECA|nr:MAG: hypothetical protein GOMPHAMPRED_000435 [Gomphillus americanus]